MQLRVILKDYWNVKKLKEQDFTLHFTLLLQAMELLLEEYESKYGVEIDSEFNLKALRFVASSDFLQDLTKLLANISMEIFHGNRKFLTEALSWIGVDVDLVELCETPKTKEEYLSKTKSYNEMRYRSLQSEYLEVYKTEREAMSAQEYQFYLQSVCQEYGSLQKYWDSLNGGL